MLHTNANGDRTINTNTMMMMPALMLFDNTVDFLFCLTYSTIIAPTPLNVKGFLFQNEN